MLLPDLWAMLTNLFRAISCLRSDRKHRDLVPLCYVFVRDLWSSKSVQSGFRHEHRRRSIYRRANHRKPDWVVKEVIRLRAHLPRLSFMKLAQNFNRLHATRGHTVSKTYVHYTVLLHQYEIAQYQRKIKQRKPRLMPKNPEWGIDLTGKTDSFGRLHFILGILDHGTCHLMSLQAVENKSSWTLLGHLYIAIGEFGKPRAIRTDNERCFTSRVFKWGLALAGIRHQTIAIAQPWQNGRIERFFGTLKQSLDEWTVNCKTSLQTSLDSFREWYGEVRPHANLNGATPYEAWHGIDPYRSQPKHVEWFHAWDGLLTGIRIRYR